MANRINFNHFSGRTVLITGHTGFKGAWLCAWLRRLGANVVGVALDPPTVPSHFVDARIASGIVDCRVDIRNRLDLERVIAEVQPDFVFHLAAQALVRNSYENPLETWEINVMGTLHVLESLRKLNKLCVAVIVTSDKCYENVEWVWGYRETDALGGADPYSASKGAAELAIRSHIKSYFAKGQSKVLIATARAGNVIGGGDWSENRIVPDCVKAWSMDQVVNLRNPSSTRPWQHVLEPLSGYLTLGLSLLSRPELHGHAFNFGPNSQQNQSVLNLVQKMSFFWNQVRWQHKSDVVNELYESGLLKLNCDKALHFLHWHSVMDFEDTIRMTAEWYRSYFEYPEEIGMLTDKQIDSYTELANRKGLEWAK